MHSHYYYIWTVPDLLLLLAGLEIPDECIVILLTTTIRLQVRAPVAESGCEWDRGKSCLKDDVAGLDASELSVAVGSDVVHHGPTSRDRTEPQSTRCRHHTLDCDHHPGRSGYCGGLLPARFDEKGWGWRGGRLLDEHHAALMLSLSELSVVLVPLRHGLGCHLRADRGVVVGGVDGAAEAMAPEGLLVSVDVDRGVGSTRLRQLALVLQSKRAAVSRLVMVVPVKEV